MMERVCFSPEYIRVFLKDPYRIKGSYIVSGTATDAQWQYIQLYDLEGKPIEGLKMRDGDKFTVAKDEAFKELGLPNIRRNGIEISTVIIDFTGNPYLVEKDLLKTRAKKRT